MRASGCSLPEEFLNRMEQLLGEEYGDFAASYAALRVDGLRTNTLKIGPTELRAILSLDALPVPWCPSGFTVPTGSPLGRHPYHAAGLYYLQEPSAMAVVPLMSPQPGERILDLCAAPGGKATHIASLMANEGLLVTNDVHPRRVRALSENLARWGARNTAVLGETPERLAQRFVAFFDRVLVDAPCSGEAMFRDDESARVHWSIEHVQGCSRRQRDILAVASEMVRPGGWLCYSTCAFSPAEDESVVASFLEARPDFEIVEPPRWPGFDRGRPEWADTSRPLERSVRIWPHKAVGEGHFMALMRRADRVPVFAESVQPVRRRSFDMELFVDFCRCHLVTEITEPIALIGNRLYGVSTELPDLVGLRAIHPGWWLGTLRPGRFEPSHALAMALRREDVHLSVDLPMDSPELVAYLRGHPLAMQGEDGWLLVTVGGYPLGWGKRVKGTIKNHYPKPLRWP